MKVRRFDKSDAHFLIDIDRKGHEYPFVMEDWEVAFNAALDEDADEPWIIDVATIKGTPRGYSFSIIDLSKLFLVRLVANPAFKDEGIEDVLFDNVKQLCLEHKRYKIQTIISESECSGVPGDSCEWLMSKGFKCVRSSPEMFTMYGRDWDGYTFELELV